MTMQTDTFLKIINSSNYCIFYIHLSRVSQRGYCQNTFSCVFQKNKN